MIPIIIETIPKKQHRYPTTGDWYRDGNIVDVIRVSNMKNGDYEFLVALHELIEMKLCQKHKVSEKSVTAFDIAFEKAKRNGEPGDDPKAPYHKEHMTATLIEVLMAGELGVNWKKYNNSQN